MPWKHFVTWGFYADKLNNLSKFAVPETARQ